MGFVKTSAEIDRYYSHAVREFPGAEMLGFLYETRPETVARLLPAPLAPAAEPWALVYMCRFPQTSLGPGYRESAIFLRCQYKGEIGNYCLSMPLDGDDDRIFNGREIYGFPKKTGSVHLSRQGDTATGWVERKGIRFITVTATLTTKMAEPPLKVGPSFLFKFQPAADLKPGFDGPVHLVRQRTEVEYHEFEMGPGDISLTHSPFDPWSEIECVQPITAYYFTSTNRMLPGEIVGEADPSAFLPHSFARTDWGFEK